MNILYPCELHMLDCVDSTNNFAKSIENLSVPHVVVSKEQTNGRGTKGRSFYSKKDKGIYLSIVYAPKGQIDTENLTTEIGKAVASVLSKYSKDTPYTKPINDVYINGKKVAGILTEADTIGLGKFSKIIIGIGINLFEQNFPDEIRDIAGFIDNPSYNFTYEEVLEDVINRIFNEFVVK